MAEALCSINEAKRRKVLFTDHVLDVAPQAAFDKLTVLVASIPDVLII
ncbi:MAG: hypothetical protein COB94_009575 [Gammaproteobacteria bacterium]|nr:hypothetical protein [Gammaproteobacteria bacterium]